MEYLKTSRIGLGNLSGDVSSSAGVTTIGTDAVDIAMISATGTADATSVLRGDNTWDIPPGATTVTNCNLTNSSGNYGWCTGTASNQNLSYSYGCTGNVIGYGWGGFNSHSSQCSENRIRCAAVCMRLKASCYRGAGNGNYVSCHCLDGSVTASTFGGYDFAAPCTA